jgi:CCR4-NOT transcriptional regulation complex NOT5 subunit
MLSTCMSTECRRPESIGEGNHRLYISDDFKNADPDLVARINKATQELNEIALELAHRAGWEVQDRKKRRTDGSDGSAEAQEHPRPSLSTNATSNSSTQNRASMQLPNHIASSNPSGSSTPVPTKDTVAVTTPPTSTPFGMEQSTIASVVSALMYVLPFRLLLSVELT